MNKKEYIKRYVLFVISLYFTALGVAFTKQGELGVSPTSSVANVMSYQVPEITLGTWLIIWNCFLIAGQIIVLRRNFKLIQLLQLPLSLIFGLFIDLSMWMTSYIPVNSYPMQLFMVASGVLILAFGVALSVIANVILNSGEAFVKALSDTFSWNFGKTKTWFDISCVAAAVLLSLVFFDFTIVGTREGTVINALFTGTCVNFYLKKLKTPIEKLL